MVIKFQTVWVHIIDLYFSLTKTQHHNEIT